jgi:hypothetical protein
VSIPEDRLMAYVDGELDAAEHAAERAQIEIAMKADPAVARRVEKHRALRAQLGGAFREVLDEPVPERLLAAVRTAPSALDVRGEASVTDLGRVRASRAEAAAEAARKRAPWSWVQWGAVAASLVVGAIIGHMAMKSPELGPIASRDGRLVAQAGLDQALSSQLASEQTASSPVHIGVSFKTKGGAYCRTFAVQQGTPSSGSAGESLSGLACREGGSWDVRALARADMSQGGEGGYQPAGSEMPAAVRAAVEDQIEGEPLDAAAEARAKASGWK